MIINPSSADLCVAATVFGGYVLGSNGTNVGALSRSAAKAAGGIAATVSGVESEAAGVTGTDGTGTDGTRTDDVAAAGACAPASIACSPRPQPMTIARVTAIPDAVTRVLSRMRPPTERQLRRPGVSPSSSRRSCDSAGVSVVRCTVILVRVASYQVRANIVARSPVASAYSATVKSPLSFARMSLSATLA